VAVANTANSRMRASKSRRSVVRCHRDGCRASGVVVVEAPCCGESVLVCLGCAWEAFQDVDRHEALDCPALAFGVLQ
jgi:hypothetical protein